MSGTDGLLNAPFSGVTGLILEFFVYVLSVVFVPVLVAVPIVLLLPFPIRISAWLAAPFAYVAAVFVLASLWYKQYPVWTFGRKRAVFRDVFVGERRQCADCDARIDRGRKHRYAEQLVAFGVVLYTTASGTNAYCPWCADGLESPLDDSSERATDTADTTTSRESKVYA